MSQRIRRSTLCDDIQSGYFQAELRSEDVPFPDGGSEDASEDPERPKCCDAEMATDTVKYLSLKCKGIKNKGFSENIHFDYGDRRRRAQGQVPEDPEEKAQVRVRG